MRYIFTIATLATLSFVPSSASAQGPSRVYTVQQPQQQNLNDGPRLGIQAVPRGNSLEVVSVDSYSPASRLGLEAGDRILQVNGRTIRSVYDLQCAMRAAAQNNNGQIRVLIDNVRARAGFPDADRFVSHATYLNGYRDFAGFDPNSIPVYTAEVKAKY